MGEDDALRGSDLFFGPEKTDPLPAIFIPQVGSLRAAVVLQEFRGEFSSRFDNSPRAVPG